MLVAAVQTAAVLLLALLSGGCARTNHFRGTSSVAVDHDAAAITQHHSSKEAGKGILP